MFTLTMLIFAFSCLAQTSNTTPKHSTKDGFKIMLTIGNKVVPAILYNTPPVRDLYSQLPLSISVGNYSNNEKIFYPPEKLNTTDTPQADGGQAGTLAYYAPWGDVVMFYSGFSSAPGFYELGHAISGAEYIRGMSGTIRIGKSSVP